MADAFPPGDGTDRPRPQPRPFRSFFEPTEPDDPNEPTEPTTPSDPSGLNGPNEPNDAAGPGDRAERQADATAGEAPVGGPPPERAVDGSRRVDLRHDERDGPRDDAWFRRTPGRRGGVPPAAAPATRDEDWYGDGTGRTHADGSDQGSRAREPHPRGGPVTGSPAADPEAFDDDRPSPYFNVPDRRSARPRTGTAPRPGDKTVRRPQPRDAGTRPGPPKGPTSPDTASDRPPEPLPTLPARPEPDDRPSPYFNVPARRGPAGPPRQPDAGKPDNAARTDDGRTDAHAPGPDAPRAGTPRADAPRADGFRSDAAPRGGSGREPVRPDGPRAGGGRPEGMGAGGGVVGPVRPRVGGTRPEPTRDDRIGRAEARPGDPRAGDVRPEDSRPEESRRAVPRPDDAGTAYVRRAEPGRDRADAREATPPVSRALARRDDHEGTARLRFTPRETPASRGDDPPPVSRGPLALPPAGPHVPKALPGGDDIESPQVAAPQGDSGGGRPAAASADTSEPHDTAAPSRTFRRNRGRGRKHRQTRAGAKNAGSRRDNDAAATESARSGSGGDGRVKAGSSTPEATGIPDTPETQGGSGGSGASDATNTSGTSESSPTTPSEGRGVGGFAGGSGSGTGRGGGPDTPGGTGGSGGSGDEPPEDPGTPEAEPSGRRRLAAALWPPRLSRAQLVVGVLLFALGAALAIQVRSNTESDPLRGARESDLVRVLDELEQRTARLDSERSRLEIDRAELESSNNAAEEARAQTDQRAQVLGILAGTVKAAGPGITLTITDPKGTVTPDMLLDTLQELRAAGAEAVQINQVRVVAETHFTQSGPGAQIFVDEQPVGQPYVFKVIGNPQDLEPALNIPGGVIRTLEKKEAQAVVVASSQVVVDALRVPTTPDYARSAPDAGNDG